MHGATPTRSQPVAARLDVRRGSTQTVPHFRRTSGSLMREHNVFDVLGAMPTSHERGLAMTTKRNLSACLSLTAGALRTTLGKGTCNPIRRRKFGTNRALHELSLNSTVRCEASGRRRMNTVQGFFKGYVDITQLLPPCHQWCDDLRNWRAPAKLGSVAIL